jgi:hypothetical protein
MSLEEYLALVGPSPPRARPPGAVAKSAAPKPKRKGKSDPKMARALKKANAMGRKKAGGFKKGWSQGKIMRKAHQLRRKM